MKKTSLLLKNVLLDGKKTNIFISGNIFSDLNADDNCIADRTLDCSGKAIVPPFFNTHTHAAMTLLRGYADDMALKTWLEDYIWPYENNLTLEDIYSGSRLAIEEMIKSGTIFFSDMYFHIGETVKAIKELGIRASLGITIMEAHSQKELYDKIDNLHNWIDPTDGRINLTIAPHAIYTVGTERLKQSAALAKELDIKLHIHVAETQSEVTNCLKEKGMTPVAFLDSIGLLGENVIAAHCVHVTDDDIKILSDRGVTVSHCPCSNMKLGSGIFRYEAFLNSGVNVTLGTDGASSNNNLDMREEAKFACLLAKCQGNPELLPAGEAFKWATVNGAKAFGINSGEIAAGKLADAVLLDLSNERMRPLHHLISNWIYSADSSCVDTVICDGRIILENRKLTA